MSELAENITANQNIVHLDEPLATSKRLYRLENELVEVTGRGIREQYDRQAPSGLIVNIVRGVGDTTAAAHASGVELVPYVEAFGTSAFVEPGGGAIAVTGTVSGSVPAATGLELEGTVTDEGGGVAGYSPGTAQALLSDTTTLTNAQIKALPTTAIELIAAPGAGFMLVPISAVARLTWVADYTNIDAGCQLAVTQESGAATNPVFLTILEENPDIGVSGLLALGDSSFAIFGPRMWGAAAASNFVHASGGWNTFSVENLPLYLRATNGVSGAFTGGDAGNSLKVTVIYTVIAI